jgi:hypothetical protein
MADDSRLFTCSRCGDRCLSSWSEEEARAEYEMNFGRRLKQGEAVEICDDCYRLLTGEASRRPQ